MTSTNPEGSETDLSSQKRRTFLIYELQLSCFALLVAKLPFEVPDTRGVLVPCNFWELDHSLWARQPQLHLGREGEAKPDGQSIQRSGLRTVSNQKTSPLRAHPYGLLTIFSQKHCFNDSLLVDKMAGSTLRSEANVITTKNDGSFLKCSSKVN